MASLAHQMRAWRTKRGTPLAASSRLSLVTALLAAGQAVLNATFSQKPFWKRLMRTIKNALALHIPRQATPMPRHALISILRHVRTPIDTCLRLMWLLGCRWADTQKLYGKDVLQLSPTAALLRMRGSKSQRAGKAAYHRVLSLRGLGAPLFNILTEAASHPEQKIIPTTYADIMRVLKAHNFTAHSLRRGAATTLADAGVSMTLIGAHLGHDSIESTRLYVTPNLGQQDLRRKASVAQLLA